MIVFLLIVAILIIAGLSLYAYQLTRQVKQQQVLDERTRVEDELKREKQQAFIVESIRVISANVLDEDLNLSEATIRCKMLLDGLILAPEDRLPYAVLDEVFELVKEFATHQSRKELSIEAVQEQDAKREEIEERYRQQLLDCFVSMRHFDLPKQTQH